MSSSNFGTALHVTTLGEIRPGHPPHASQQMPRSRPGRTGRRRFTRRVEEHTEAVLIESAWVIGCWAKIPVEQRGAETEQLVRHTAAVEIKEEVTRIVVGKVWLAPARWQFSRMRRVLELLWNQASRVLSG